MAQELKCVCNKSYCAHLSLLCNCNPVVLLQAYCAIAIILCSYKPIVPKCKCLFKLCKLFPPKDSAAVLEGFPRIKCRSDIAVKDALLSLRPGIVVDHVADFLSASVDGPVVPVEGPGSAEEEVEEAGARRQVLRPPHESFQSDVSANTTRRSETSESDCVLAASKNK